MLQYTFLPCKNSATGTATEKLHLIEIVKLQLRIGGSKKERVFHFLFIVAIEIVNVEFYSEMCAVSVHKKCDNKNAAKCYEFSYRCFGTVVKTVARDPRSVTRRVRSKWRARLVNKVGKISNLFPRRTRTFAYGAIERSCGPVERGTIVGTRPRVPCVHVAIGNGFDESRVQRKMEVCLQQCAACVLSTTVHSGSFDELRARARCIIIASRNRCDIATCLCAIL